MRTPQKELDRLQKSIRPGMGAKYYETANKIKWLKYVCSLPDPMVEIERVYELCCRLEAEAQWVLDNTCYDDKYVRQMDERESYDLRRKRIWVAMFLGCATKKTVKWDFARKSPYYKKPDKK